MPRTNPRFIPHTVSEALIYKCQVVAVRPETVGVDVYVPYTKSEYRGVYILSQALGKTNGTVAMPEVGAEGLLLLYHKSNMPVFLGTVPQQYFYGGNVVYEPLMPGETQSMSVGGGFINMDSSGNTTLGAVGEAEQLMLVDGTSMNVASAIRAVSNLYRNSLHINNNNDIISLDGEIELYKEAPCKAYSEAEIVPKGTINSDVEQKILNAANDIMDSLLGDNGVYNKLNSVVDSLTKTHTCTKEDIEDYVACLESAKLPKTGVSIRVSAFNEKDFKLCVLNNDEEIAGIVIDSKTNKGTLTGNWDI